MTRIYSLYIDESGDHSYGKKELRSFRIKFKERMIDYPTDYYPELEREVTRRHGRLRSMSFG